MSHSRGEVFVQRVEILVVHVNPGIAAGIDIEFPAVDGQIGRPSQVDNTATVVFVGVEDAIAVAVIAEQELRRHPLDQQQLFQAVQRAVFGAVSRSRTTTRG